MSRKLVSALALSTCLLMLASPAAAEEPWLAEMPSVDRVVAGTAGTDDFDTAARQWVVFGNLYETSKGLIGDPGGMTPAERTLRDAYLGNRDRVLRELQASLPPEERGFYIGTRFAEWSALRDRYLADTEFRDQQLNALFSAEFRRTHAQLLNDKWLSPRGLGLSPTPAPKPLVEAGTVLPVVAVFLVGFIIPLLLKRGRMKVDPKNVFRLYLGGGTYELQHVTGKVENAAKMGTTNVYGYGGGGSDGYSAPVTVSSSTTIHDQFFVRQPDGRLESVQLKGWDFPVANDHVVSAVWAIRQGSSSGPFFVLRNHTTGDTEYASAFLVKHVMQGGYGRWWLQLILSIAAGVVAAPVLGFPLAIGAALVGAFVGSVVRHSIVKPRFLRRFARAGLPRLYAELDRTAAATASP